jgi:carbon storage regulator (csrA)
MLVLSRKRGQSIVINSNIEIFVTAIEGDQVKLGIRAPREYSIHRKEVLEDVRASNQNAISRKFDIQELERWVQSHNSEHK